MDGGGRLARSQRSPRPRTDLKAAALGAIVLLREWLGAKRQPARAQFDRAEDPPRLVAFLERYLPRRAGTTATVLLLLSSAGLGVVKGGHIEEMATSLSDARNGLANSAGFRITTVAINGRRQLTQDEVLAIGGVNGRASLLFLDAAALREKLKANPWISEATVLKLYPGELRIDIVERSAFALWQRDGRLSVISDDGAVLEPYVSPRFLSLPLFVGERRWNLRLKDGLDIRLPENDIGNALATLSTLDKEDRLFSRDIVAVDMRLADRFTVQLSEDAAKAREDLFKDKKPKKKVGDA
jgi:cell division protein FtsQ